MHKRCEAAQPSESRKGRRVLARALAVDLREVKTGAARGEDGVLKATGTITEPPPGRDFTTIGADGDLY